jgi:hypothetical protein
MTKSNCAAGAYTLLRGAAYDAEVSFLPCADSPADGGSPVRECRWRCGVCRSPATPTAAAVGKDAAFMSSSRKALEDGNWVHAQVSFLPRGSMLCVSGSFVCAGKKWVHAWVLTRCGGCRGATRASWRP